MVVVVVSSLSALGFLDAGLAGYLGVGELLGLGTGSLDLWHGGLLR